VLSFIIISYSVLVVQVFWAAEAEIRLFAVVRTPLRKPSEQKKLAERRGDATPVGVEVSISQGNLGWLKACFKSRLVQYGVPIYFIFDQTADGRSEEIERYFSLVS
jgi:hypothetical protein